MRRRWFVKIGGMMLSAFIFNKKLFAMPPVKPLQYLFEDDGSIPNSKYPLLVYQHAFSTKGSEGAIWLKEKFASNHWTNSWRWGIYPFHHYHSNTHEVLGVCQGNALLHMGGEQGQKINVEVGDILVIPAGVGHKCLKHSNDFTVVGAYPNGLSPDMNKCETGERPKADTNIAAVALPETDPLLGKNGGLRNYWL